MTALGLDEHLNAPVRRGHTPAGGFSAGAGGGACGDLLRITVAVEGDRVSDAGFDASGCGTAIAAGSAAVALAVGQPILEVARIGSAALAAELGGLSVGKLHASDLAADALARALGAAVAANASCQPTAGRALVAMSGGVDSAVAALLTSQTASVDPVAVTLELWADPENDGESSCCSAQAVRTARALAHRMGLAHITLDLRDQFRSGVVEPFIADHANGLTPNPCVRCNGHVRLDAMLELGERLGAQTLVTGHYARTALSQDGGTLLRLAADPNKDQAYMLAAVSPTTLTKLRFPLGDLTKPEVRAIAAEADLPVAQTPDSQDLCFLAGTDRASFLARHGSVRERPGEILDRSGRVLGRHRGHHNFTVGQRKGLGLGGGEPLYVLSTDARTNRVVVGERAALRTFAVEVRAATLHADSDQVDAVKLRYRAAPLSCRITSNASAGRHARLTLELSDPTDGAAPGQAAVLLCGDRVIGHATITLSTQSHVNSAAR